jgi:NarL family two-component system response regulator LiaR
MLAVNDIELVGEAADGEEALRVCEEVRPDVVLMDIRMPGSIGAVEAIQILSERCPRIKVLALSSYYDHDLVQGAVRAGAVGYLVKGIPGEELAEAIRAAHAGRPILAQEALKALVQPAKETSALGEDLTEREREVLALLVQGKSNAQMAESLMVTVAAVKFHVSNILSKLGASNRTEAAAKAREYRLVDL